MMQVNGWEGNFGFVTPMGSLAPSSTPQSLGHRPSPVNARNVTGIYAANERIQEQHIIGPLHLMQPLSKFRGNPRAPFMLPEIHQKDKATVRPMDNVRRGFTGLPLKKKTQSSDSKRKEKGKRKHQERTDPTVWLPEYRQTARNFTLTTSSSAIPRLENLVNPPEDSSVHTQSLLSAHLVANQITKRNQHDALAACYNQVLKGNMDALAILLPSKSQGVPKKGSNILSARLQNPQQAQIMAFFPGEQNTMKRISQSASVLNQRATHRSQATESGSHKKSGNNNAPHQEINQSALRTVELVLPSVGGGVHSQVHTSEGAGVRQSGATIPPRNTPASKPSGERAESPEAQEEEKEENRVLIALPSDEEDEEGAAIGPPAAVLEGTKDAESAAEAVAKHLEACGTAAEICSTHSIEIKVDQTDASSMEGRSSGILILMEDDSGQRPIEIDEADDDVKVEPGDVPEPGNEIEETENAANKRRVSITERILKSKNHEQILASITESTETRKKMLEELLSEHQQLVHELSSMEGSSTDTDKENEGINEGMNNKEISEKTSPVN